MSKNNLMFRKTIAKRRVRNLDGLVLFRYGVLANKSKAKGYCKYHNCFISYKDLTEKHCNHKHCRHFKKEIEVFG